MNTEEFIKKSKEIFGEDTYDYSETEYVNSETKVKIICKIHGPFYKRPRTHLRQHEGCPKCSRQNGISKKKIGKEEFIKRAREIHGDKYDYSQVEFDTLREKVKIICPIHGPFWQTASKHIHKKQGCPKCGVISCHNKQRGNKEEFIAKCNDIYGSKYDYSLVEYVDRHTKVKIICPKHGVFEVRPYDMLNGHSCPQCGYNTSNAELEIMDLVSELNPIHRDRSTLDNMELDIFIPSIPLGIEYNGLRWHSELFRPNKNHHLNKLNECNKKGIKLIQVFEDEWVNHQEICIDKIRHICGLNSDKTKVYGRETIVKGISKRDADEFLNLNHLQGKSGYTIRLGAFHNGELVGVMTFKIVTGKTYELNRFATSNKYNCVGVGGKLFSYFTKNVDFDNVISFADRRWTVDHTDNFYTKLGFEFHSFVPPTYSYYYEKKGNAKRYHKFNFRKQLLHKRYGFPLTMTESEMTKELGYVKIWDCGLIKYIYNKNPHL